MQVRAGMSDVVLTVNPGHSLRDAARAMASRGVGAAVVMGPEQPGPGIVTERDLLQSLAANEDPDVERVCDHLSPHLTFAAPDWSLERAAMSLRVSRIQRCTANSVISTPTATMIHDCTTPTTAIMMPTAVMIGR